MSLHVVLGEKGSMVPWGVMEEGRSYQRVDAFKAASLAVIDNFDRGELVDFIWSTANVGPTCT
eukprot:5925852-Ditylum_brightwellii.AAC.1